MQGMAFRRRARSALLAVFMCTVAAAMAEPQEPVRVWSGPDAGGQYWADETGRASFDAARAAFEAGQGRPADPTVVMPLGGGRAVWYRLQLPPVQAPARAVLTVPFPGMDVVEMFRPQGAGRWYVERAGDSLPVEAWPVRYMYPAFAFTVHPDEAQATYLRVQHSHPIAVSWVLRDASSFGEAGKLWHLALGAYVGFMVLVIVLSVANAAAWRDAIHLYYAVHVVLVGLSQLSLTGLAGEYLWPGNAWWNDIASVALPAGGLAWLGLFLRELVAERGRRWVSWLLLAHTAVAAALMLAFLLVGRKHAFVPYNIYSLAGMALVVGVLVWYSLRRPQSGLWVLAGLAILAAGMLFPVLRNLGYLPVTFATQYGPQIAAALEIPLVLVGLYFRSRERRDNRLRLHSLAFTDPLTGLSKHRVLVDRLEVLARRAQRDPTLGAVMRVHVRNLDQIRNEHGREAAEAALVRAAECVAREASEGDTVARERGGDLVLLMDGAIQREQAAAAGRNVVARGLKFSGLLPPGVTLSLQVAMVCAPLPAAHAEQLLADLHDLIGEMGNDTSGRAVRIVGGAEPSAIARGPADVTLAAGQ
jgi:GGDEF domain-containing protein